MTARSDIERCSTFVNNSLTSRASFLERFGDRKIAEFVNSNGVPRTNRESGKRRAPDKTGDPLH
jgi:hypothetical protein